MNIPQNIPEKKEEPKATVADLMSVMLEDIETAEIHFNYQHTAVVHYMKTKLRLALGMPVTLTELAEPGKENDMQEMQKPGDKPVN